MPQMNKGGKFVLRMGAVILPIEIHGDELIVLESVI